MEARLPHSKNRKEKTEKEAGLKPGHTQKRKDRKGARLRRRPLQNCVQKKKGPQSGD
jgi:hypothetical protein